MIPSALRATKIYAGETVLALSRDSPAAQIEYRFDLLVDVGYAA